MIFVILVGGVAAYLGMPRDYDPGFTIRTAVVATFFPGASPERVEQLVTDKLEKVIQEIPELKVVRSESGTGPSARVAAGPSSRSRVPSSTTSLATCLAS